MLWRFLYRWRRVIALAAVPVAAFVALTGGLRRRGTAGRLEAAAAVVVEPLQAGVAGGFSRLGDVALSVFGGVRLRRENEELRREVARLRGEVEESRERVAEAARLERLLEYRRRAGFRMTAAGVIGHDTSGLYRTILIDRGEGDGIAHNQAVLAPDGVVGRVIRTYPGSALVLLVTDRSSGIDAVVQRTRDQGVVQGRGGDLCGLKYLARQAEVAVGDDIVTSGMGGGFPKGVRIGQVSRIEGGGDLFQSVEVRPTAELDRLEEVWVVTGAREEPR